MDEFYADGAIQAMTRLGRVEFIWVDDGYDPVLGWRVEVRDWQGGQGSALLQDSLQVAAVRAIGLYLSTKFPRVV